MRLVDLQNNIDVILEAREVVEGASFQFIGNLNATNTSEPVAVQLDGSNVIIDADVPAASCARILLGYDENEDVDQVQLSSNPDFLSVDGFPCTEFGTNLIWFMIFNDLYKE